MPNSRPWSIILPILFFCGLVFGVTLIFKAAWFTALMFAAVLVVSVIIINKSVRFSRDLAVLARISRPSGPADNILAYKLLAEMDLSAAEKKFLPVKASEIVRERFQLERFAIFFQENDRYVPSIYSGVNKGELANPSVQELSPEMKGNLLNGALSKNKNDCLLAYRRDSDNFSSSTVAFAFSWGRARSVYIVANDPMGRFSETVRDSEFNRIFWPGLENDFRLSQRLQERGQVTRELGQQLEQARRDISEINRELKNKLSDLKVFLNISNDLLSLYDEEKLFARLKTTICGALDAGSAEILLPSGDSRFIPQSAKGSDRAETPLSLEGNSELADLISRSTKPVLLPLAGSGLKQNEPFLRAAFNSNFEIAAAIKTEDQLACILLLAQKGDKSQYTAPEIDFLNIICNIASLALENIHQYSTIEKLSYTDSMTGIYNYRYFYKRLHEEILRAKRYDRELALVILDIDNFKSFNDNYGHQAGDLVLKYLSDMITKTIRSIDVVSRYGGEEFCIIMPDTGVGDCQIFIERLRSQIADFKFESELFRQGSKITISVGGAVYPFHAPAPDRLIYCADMALLKAKSLGRNRAVMYEPDPSVDSNSGKGGINESRQESIL